jgi:hypothetical protein
LHVPTVIWGVGVVAFGLPCPLTQLEQWARARAGMDPLPMAGFVERYIAGVCYPSNATGIVQRIAFGAAAVSWLAFGSQCHYNLSSRRTRRFG